MNVREGVIEVGMVRVMALQRQWPVIVPSADMVDWADVLEVLCRV